MFWLLIGDYRGEWKVFLFYDNNSLSYVIDNSGLM